MVMAWAADIWRGPPSDDTAATAIAMTARRNRSDREKRLTARPPFKRNSRRSFHDPDRYLELARTIADHWPDDNFRLASIARLPFASRASTVGLPHCATASVEAADELRASPAVV